MKGYFYTSVIKQRGKNTIKTIRGEQITVL